MNIKNALEFLRKAAADEQKKGKKKLESLGISNVGATIEDVIEKIPKNSSNDSMTAEMLYSSNMPIIDVITTEG